ncbi:DUF3991 domain-containing protein [Paenibacillus naphthalenovorans]|uniref:DUF3991 domain-containing protein n=1 Tax=Paenibacillus naphthalenovorans TaxID=162209 RepID=UPI003D2D0A5F
MPYVNKEQIERAKQWDLLAYLQHVEPYELVRLSRNVYSTRTHDSLKISNGKWFWWSRGIGGRSALDYLIKVRDMSFTDAVLHIDGQELEQAPMRSPKYVPGSVAKQLELPERYDNANRVTAYLSKRGIHRSVIDFCLETGKLYESRRYHNAVFVGFDRDGIPRYAAIRGTTASRYLGEAVGSDKRFSFSLPARETGTTLHLFESAVDLLSFCTMQQIAGKDWRQSHHLSLAGIHSSKQQGRQLPVALTQYLKMYPQINRIALHLDQDEPGRQAARTIRTLLPSSISVADEPPKFGKDVNDELLLRLERPFHRSRQTDGISR